MIDTDDDTVGADTDIADTEHETTETPDDFGIDWVRIPAGSFKMGCQAGDTLCWDNESPLTTVTLEAFEMTRTEITQKQFSTIMSYNPSHFSECGDDCPVEMVKDSIAAEFCKKVGGSLPTEAQWEYAARGGNTNFLWVCGNDPGCLPDVAWHYSTAEKKTHPVKQNEPNDFGLYDMMGNVGEWCVECMDDYDWRKTSRATTNGLEACSEHRAERGGPWVYTEPPEMRLTYRGFADIKRAYFDIGIRCVRSAN